MTFPFESNRVYKSKSFKKIVKKCYGEFKQFSDIDEGLFCITNLDKDIEYRFKVTDKKIEKIKSYQGGTLDEEKNKQLADQAAEIAKEDDDPEPVEEPSKIEPAELVQLETKIDATNQSIADMKQELLASEESEKGVLNEILAKTSQTHEPTEPPKGKELLEDINVYDDAWRRLIIQRSLANIEGKNETCTIL